jgi:hypothetical protein
MAQRILRMEAAALLACACTAIAGCAGSQTKTDENALDTTATASPSGSAAADDTPKWNSKPSNKEKDDPLTEDQKAQMEIALRRGGEKAANCAAVVPDSKTGEGEVKVTFDGKKGRAVEVTVGAPWAGTPVESCIKRSFVGEIIVPFEGELEVPYTVKLTRAEAVDPKAKGKDPKAKDPKKK